MNITLAHTFVAQPIAAATVKAEEYLKASQRFVNSLKQFPPYRPFDEVMIICAGGAPTPEVETLFEDVATCFTIYMGQAKDCGAYLSAAEQITTEWAMFMCSHAWWNHPSSLYKLVDAAERNGDGLYGPSASYEISPHIRTSCILTRTENLRKYPHRLLHPSDANRFECGDISFTSWMRSQGKPCILVTHEGAFLELEWRTAKNAFRNGDQSNTLIWDRHTEIYDQSGPLARAKLQAAADGK